MLPGDVADPDFCQRAVEKTVDRVRRGSTFSSTMLPSRSTPTSFADLTDEHFDRTLKTNLYGYFYMAKAAVPHMKPAPPSSTPARSPASTAASRLLDYSMTKGGIHAFTRSLAAQSGRARHTRERVAPGPVWTPLNPADKPAEEGREFGSRHADEARRRSPRRSRRPTCSWRRPSCSSYITGEILPIIGGYSGG